MEIITHTYEIEGSTEAPISGTEVSQIVRPLPILKNYELLLHPIRLIIVKVLVAHYSLLRSDLLDLTGLNSGTLQTHLDTLEKNKWISKEIEFVDNRPRSILYIEAKGSQVYREFMDIFKEHILGI
jgi:DNA-binding MarR family transcriptional regulator